MLKWSVRPEPLPHPESSHVRLVLVDFDDTLVDTGPRFSSRRERLFRFLEAEGFERAEAERVHHEVVDSELLSILGYGPFRLGPSFRDTYVRLCVIQGRIPGLSTARAAEALAEGVEAPSPPFPGALDALQRLADRVPTAIYTQSAFPRYQMRCLAHAGVLDIVPAHRIRITPAKTATAFRRTLDSLGAVPPEGAWMVGNSVRSDVNPALETGARAVWINGSESWHHDRAAPLRDVPTSPTFAEAVDRILLKKGR
jgi:putative hydrolase of the HAD superfamily